MSEQERENQPSEPAPEVENYEDAPKPEEVLSERISETAEAVTTELKDLQESLTPAEPVVEPLDEPLAESGEGVEAVAAASAAEQAIELPADAPDQQPRSAASAPESSSDDRLASALAWLSMVILQLPILSIIQLLSPTNRERPFQRHHAVTSLLYFAAAVVYEIVAGIAYFILGLVTLGIGFACLWVIFFVPHLLGLYYALQAYNGKHIELPILSDFARGQGWM